MATRVTLKLGAGGLKSGFSVALQMGEEGAAPTLELSASLPAAPALHTNYRRWQKTYRRQAQSRSARIQAHEGFATNVSFVEDTSALAQQLKKSFNRWLQSETFRPIQEKLLERLGPTQTIQLVIQTTDSTVQRLPWHQWSLCDRFPTLEIALSAPTYEATAAPTTPLREKVRILAILGNSKGLDIKTDQTLLSHLPNAEIQYLQSPDRPTLNERLWDPAGWDILFFAGHSSTEASISWTAGNVVPGSASGETASGETVSGETDSASRATSGDTGATAADIPSQNSVGKLYINATESITIPELKHALSKAVSRGLKIAIFNSCDGLGLAQSLADLHLSQTLVMRELVPDPVAHAFLKSFLSAFSRGEPLYLAVREAREKLQGLESQFPCASWLPIIYQNPAVRSPLWRSLYRTADDSEPIPAVSDLVTQQSIATEATPPKRESPRRFSTHGALSSLITSAVVAIALIGMQSLGLFQFLDLKAFDQLMRLRPKEGPDPRILVVKVTAADVQAQSSEERNGSLSDRALAAVLEQLKPMEPRLIGLDIYRDFAVRADQPELSTALETTDNLLMVCKSSNTAQGDLGVAPPSGVPENRIGFSDFVDDPDHIVRRQLLSMTPEPASVCQSTYSLSSLLALSYLSAEGVELQPNEDGTLKLGEVALTPLSAHDGGYRHLDDWGYQLLLNYRSLENPADIAEQVTLADVLDGKVTASAVRDRIVLIGTTDSSFKDYWRTPYSRSSAVEDQTYGVFMQAQMVSHLLSAALDERPLLKTWPEWGEWLWIVGWTGVGGLVAWLLWQSPGISVKKALLALLATEVGLLCLGWALLAKAHYWVPIVPAAIAPVAVVVGTTKLKKAS